MYNITDWVRALCATVAGLFSWVYGGLDMLLAVLLVCVVIDYMTGILAAIYQKKLNSQVGFRGILKKVAILLIVALGSLVGQAVGQATIRDLVIGFYIANEGISILENASKMNIKCMEKLKIYLSQISKTQ